MKTGAQLYTVRAYTQTERDFSRTVKKIAEMGYTTVQISAIGKEIRPERVRKICEENGLKIVLTHSDWNRILNDTDRLIEEHEEIYRCVRDRDREAGAKAIRMHIYNQEQSILTRLQEKKRQIR